MPQSFAPAPRGAPTSSQTVTVDHDGSAGGAAASSGGGGSRSSWGPGQTLGGILNASRASAAMGGGGEALAGQPLPRGTLRDLPALSEVPPAEADAVSPAAGGGASGDVQARLEAAQAEVARRRDQVDDIVRWHEASLRQIEEDRSRIQAELARETEMLHAEGQVTANLDETTRQLEAELDKLDGDKREMESEVQRQKAELATMERELELAEAQLHAQEQRIEQLLRALEQQEVTQRDYERQLEDMRRQEREILDQLEASQASIAKMEEILQRLEQDEQITREELQAAMQETVQRRRDLQDAEADYSNREQGYETATRAAEAEEMNAQFRQQELERVRRRCQELDQQEAEQRATVERLREAAEQERREMERLQEEMRQEERRVQELEEMAQQDERNGDDHCAMVYRDHKRQHQERLNAARRQLGTNNERNAARLRDAERRLTQHQQMLRGEQSQLADTTRSKEECDRNLARLRGTTEQAHSDLIAAENVRGGARVQSQVALATEAALQSDVRRLTDHIAWQRTQTQQLESRRDRIVQQKQNMERDIQRCSEDIAQRKQEIAALEADAAANCTEVGAKRQTIERKRSELSTLEIDLASVQRDVDRAESQLQETNANLAENRQCAQMHREYHATLHERSRDLEGRQRHVGDQFARERALRQDAVRTAESELQRAQDAVRLTTQDRERDRVRSQQQRTQDTAQQRDYARGV
jgi:chromosome segregation ATPase